ncbi:hypothetical protein Barb7_02610 [Bacteroidales bacterium Barb7]|nr:hypothetical protein Barb7_02610 [Bacteroidales bacterium Barb7]
METDRNPRHRLQVSGIQQQTGHFQRVNHIAGRECKGEILQHILLIIINNGIGEVNRIGGILFQRIPQLHRYARTDSLNNRHLQLWRRDNHILRRLLQLHQLVKQEHHFLPFIIKLIGKRVTARQAGRLFIIRPAVRIPDARARVD